VTIDAIRAAGFTPIAADLYPEGERRCPTVKLDFNAPLPFATGAFAAVVLSEGIEHHPSQTAFIGELGRILAPGGILIITTPNTLNLRARLAYLLNGNYSFRRAPVSEFTQTWGENYLGHVHLVGYSQLRFMLWQCGMGIRQVTTAKWSGSALLLAPFLYLPVWLGTTHLFRRAFRRQPDACRQMLEHLRSPDLLLGKKLIVVAEKGTAARVPAGFGRFLRKGAAMPSGTVN
jgi:SAM-dependent methyltransferase